MFLFLQLGEKVICFMSVFHLSSTVFSLLYWDMGRIIFYSLGLKSNFLFEVEVENWFLLYAALCHSCVMLLNTLPGCCSPEDSLLTISCLLLGGIDIHRHCPILSPQEVCAARNAFSSIKSIAWGHISSKLQSQDSKKGLLTLNPLVLPLYHIALYWVSNSLWYMHCRRNKMEQNDCLYVLFLKKIKVAYFDAD